MQNSFIVRPPSYNKILLSFIAKLFGSRIYFKSNTLFNFERFLNVGNIQKKERQHKRFSENELKPYLNQILDAISYCHDLQICHRDIKLENIIVNQNSQEIKIIDFSLSSENSRSLITFCGTPCYMAPEIVLRKPYNGYKADVWAVGVLIYVCLSGKFPFNGKTEEETYKMILRCRPKMYGSFSQKIKSLLDQIFQKDSSQRPTCRQIQSFINE